MTKEVIMPEVTVLMPTYNQEKFIQRAIASLIGQTFANWELIIINDASPDSTEKVVKHFLDDERITYYENKLNKGLGACLNYGISRAKSSLIAYLPSDDVIYKNHLQSLKDAIENHDQCLLAYSSVRHHYNRTCEGIVNNEWLQLVQVMHRKTKDLWLERKQIESEDLNHLFWSNFQGKEICTEQLTCEWVDHPNQRHKIMQEPIGGINTFRSYYNVTEPLRYQTTKGNFIDEVARFAPHRQRPSTPHKKRD